MSNNSDFTPYEDLFEEDGPFGKLMREFENLSEEEQKAVLDKMQKELLNMDFLKVTESEWSHTHPDRIKCGSDKFYAALATKIIKAFNSQNLPPDLPPDFVSTAAKGIAAYLEDLKSDFGIWQAQRSIYSARYGKPLPFFETTDDYYEDDLNVEDIKVIIWQAFNRCGACEERTFSPFSPAVNILADIAFDILVEEFDSAPAAVRARDFMHKALRRSEYFDLRHLAFWLSASSPLTADPFMDDYIEHEAENYGNLSGMKNFCNKGFDYREARYVAEASQAWLKYMGLTGYSTARVLSVMAEYHGYKETSEKLLTVKPEPIAFYVKETVSRHSITFRNSLGEKFNVAINSLNKNIRIPEVDGAFMTIVRFGDTYCVNGLCVLMQELPERAEKEPVGKPTPEMWKSIEDTIARNKGRRVYYCRSLDDVAKVMGNDMKPVPMNENQDEGVKNYLLLLSSSDGAILIADACGVFKDKENPFYIRFGGDRKGEDAWSFICNHQLPDDVIEYIVGKNLLPSAFMGASQGKGFGKEIVQNNMDFLFHFYRVASHSPEDEEEWKN